MTHNPHNLLHTLPQSYFLPGKHVCLYIQEIFPTAYIAIYGTFIFVLIIYTCLCLTFMQEFGSLQRTCMVDSTKFSFL